MPVTTTTRVQSSGTIAQIIRPQVEQNMVPRVRRVTQRAIALAPTGETGRMKRSIRMRARDAGGRFAAQTPGNDLICAFEISVEVPYANFVLRGTRGPYPIVSHGPWPLRNARTGQIFGQRVMHPGQRANNFLGQALEEAF